MRFPRGAGSEEDFRCVVVVVARAVVVVVVGFDAETVVAVVVVVVGKMYFRVRANRCRNVRTTKCDGDL